jgi:hypothetical protein
MAEQRYLDGRAALFPDTARDEADRLHSSMELAVMADTIAEMDGLDPAKRTEPEAITARAQVLVADLVEPARAAALDQLDEGQQGLEIATAWLRAQNARSAVGADIRSVPEDPSL